MEERLLSVLKGYGGAPRATIAIAALGLVLGCSGQTGSSECLAAPPPTPDGAPPTLLASGLYCGEELDVTQQNLEFEPAYALWTDGAAKRRWLHIPEGLAIDTSDADHWSFPVGTRAWKEFAVDGEPVETRLIERWGEGSDDFNFASYIWQKDGSDADLVPATGLDDVDGSYDIPSEGRCRGCHENAPETLLGASAIQLTHEATDALGELGARGQLTHALPPDMGFPGDESARDALGYLHANCGHCHQEGGLQFDPPMVLRVYGTESAPEETQLFATTVGVPTAGYARGMLRVAPGDPGASAIVERMQARDGLGGAQMPPIGTEQVHGEGVQAVATWIRSVR